jgi:hypothetical protein
MTKPVKFLLIAGGILLILFLAGPFIYGILSTINPQRALQEAQQQTIENQIKNVIEQALDISTEDAVVIKDAVDDSGRRAVGRIIFSDDPIEYWWLAILSEDPSTGQMNWRLLASGGEGQVVNCGLVNDTNFPAELVPSCFDEAMQEVVVR